MISPRGATRSEQDALEAAEHRGIEAGISLAIEYLQREGHKQAADRLRAATLKQAETK